MKVWGPIAGALFLVTTIAGICIAQTAPSTQASASAVVVELKGQIDDFSRRSLERHFAEARNTGARTVILKINTYGGLVTSALDMSRFIKRQNDLHTIAFVDDKAISAG